METKHTGIAHPGQTRVIVTRIEHDGKSDYQEALIDTDVGEDSFGVPVFKVSQLWGTADDVAVVGTNINPAQVVDPWFPGPGGVRFRFFTFMPTTESGSRPEDKSPLLETVQGEGLSNFVEAFDPDRPGMHISDSVDFVLVLTGEIVLELENREVVAKQGDAIVMRGGWHNWRNESKSPCTVVSVMVGARRKGT
ncbi:cupin domain-containing protein [Paraburkholderia sp. RCC_158]|uniref:cupin domain-containing protein n=1 Tax=Paraburkholderia sp. RCC_158 TaxID=3239220 RepID=UPI003524F986